MKLPALAGSSSPNIALQKSLLDGLFAVLAVTIVDYFYIILAIAGIGKLLEKKKVKKTLGIISSIVLICFGFYMAKNISDSVNVNLVINNNSSNISKSFISTFLLTISSLLTIVFWTSVFAARSIEYSLTKKELVIFGLSAGLATPLFLSISIFIISILRSFISPFVIQLANILVALVLIGYGVVRIIRIKRK